ncbi:alpha/beta fold hydrolase [Corynebacterium auriscanis]|uniref:alpha/beta fold hydrolase n=1 Tax=Corynebacterium auriscanis TaxID=99807 RepID=UPI003CE6C8B7
MTNSDSIDSKNPRQAAPAGSHRDAARNKDEVKRTETIATRMADSSTSMIRVFPAGENTVSSGADSEGKTGATQPPLIVIWPGWGMGARYYDPMGRELASRGYNVATGELHGQGSSTARATRTKKWGYHEMASQDYPRTIRAAKERFNLPETHPVVLLCHSMGGQIGSLFLARPEASELNVVGMIGVGAGTPFYKGFSGAPRYQLQYGAPVMRLVTKALGYQPEGKLDFAGYGRQSGVHVGEWFRLSRTNRFINLSGADLNYETALQEITTPVLLLRFRNDYDCTTRSAHNLASMMPKSKTLKRRGSGPEVETIEGKLGHNRWAREPEQVATRVEEFITDLEK